MNEIKESELGTTIAIDNVINIHKNNHLLK